MRDSIGTLTFESWRNAVRPLLAEGKTAGELLWRELPTTNHGAQAAQYAASDMRLPRSLIALLENLACFRDDGRWELMYRLAWRTLYESPQFLSDGADPDVAKATLMERAVRRDVHKMHAFVRFREVVREGEVPSYFAWFEPQHQILRKGVDFFVKRFPNMSWTIATPDGAALWDTLALNFVDADPGAERPRSDAHEDLWRTYYRAICNVTRINPSAMQREMPQRYWRNLPEAADIAPLIREGAARFASEHEEGDYEHLSAAKSLQQSLANVRPSADGVQSCRACDIWKHATQAVPGEGSASARIMLIGEQPGDEEDLRGVPFIGPAGKVLADAMTTAGLKRSEAYVTNAVKHFKWEPRGKRRLHKRPNMAEIRACNVWLLEEIATIRPRVIVALGATALAALVGGSHSIDAARHMQLKASGGATIVATYHPSAILRAEDARRDDLRTCLVTDLKRAAALSAD